MNVIEEVWGIMKDEVAPYQPLNKISSIPSVLCGVQLDPWECDHIRTGWSMKQIFTLSYTSDRVSEP